MSAKKITDFLPKAASKRRICVQARIPDDLHEAVRIQIEQDRAKGVKLDWNLLFEAACRSYLAERLSTK